MVSQEEGLKDNSNFLRGSGNDNDKVSLSYAPNSESGWF